MNGMAELPSAEDASLAKEAIRALGSALRLTKGPTVRVTADGDAREVIVPRHAFELFLDVLGQMANGNAVTLVPVHAELTTQQAAELLNVSRPHVVKLLEAGELKFHKVGTHRRISAAEVFAFKRARADKADLAMAELARLSQELGLE